VAAHKDIRIASISIFLLMFERFQLSITRIAAFNAGNAKFGFIGFNGKNS
jgi:hypothetical protein